MQEPRYYQVPLWGRSGKVRDFAVVDYADVLSVAVWRWCRNSNGYAVRTRDGKQILLHRQLLDLRHGDGLEVDHINRDRLDNRRVNLRLVTRGMNMMNMSPHHAASQTSRYRGVHWNRRIRKWVASAEAAGQVHHLGSFGDEDVARETVRVFWAGRGIDSF